VVDVLASLSTRRRRATRARHSHRRIRAFAHDYAPSLAIAVLLVAVTQALLLALPSTASALDLNPIHWVASLAGDAASLGSDVVVKGFVAILNSLFSGLEARLTLHVLTWLTSIANQSGGHIASLYGLTSGMAIGLLGAVLTVSVVRYWLSGLSMSGAGGFEAIEGLLRTLAAVGGLLAWPFMFNQLIAISNIASATVLGDAALRREIATIINTVVFVTFAPGGVVGLFISIVVAVAGALLFLGLLFMKVMVGAAITFLYIAMPLAMILWPIDELAWLARYAARAFISLLIIPVVWALIFATFAAVSVNALEFQGAHGFVNQVTQPLVAIAMLWLTVTIPRTLFKLASGGLGMGRHTGGFVSHAGSFLAARQASEFLTERGMMPFGRNGFANQSDGAQSQPRSGGSTQEGPRSEGGTPSGDAGPSGGAAAPVAAPAVAEVVEQLAAASAGPAAAASEAASVDADADAGAAAQSNEQSEQPPAGSEHAAGPSVGALRPQRDHPNTVEARPPVTPANERVLEQALGQARNLPRPSIEAAHAAYRGLGPDAQQRMAEAHEGGGARAVQRETALMSTSDRISNAQSQDLMTMARASEHGMVESLMGLPDTASSLHTQSAPAQSTAAPAATAYRPAVTDTPHGPWTPEESAHREVRDDAWRRAGPSINPRQD
jgi:hypothetical protein